MVLATPVQLREKIQAMSYRVRELEEALEAAQVRISPDNHPLLLQTTEPEHARAMIPDKTSSITINEEEADGTNPAAGLARTFGTLTITPERGLKVSDTIVLAAQ